MCVGVGKLAALTGLLVLGACAASKPDLPDNQYPQLVLLQQQISHCLQNNQITSQDEAEALSNISRRIMGFAVDSSKYAEARIRYADQISSQLSALTAVQRQTLCRQILVHNAQARQEQIHNAQMAVLNAQRQAAAIAASMPTVQPYQPVYVPPMVMPQTPSLQQPRNTVWCRNATGMIVTCW